MFDHSIKVPRLYKTASKIAKEVSEGRGSIKQLVYECKHPNIKALYALVVHTFQRTDDIEKLLKKSKLLIKEPRFDPWLAKILITELLWGKKRLSSQAKPVKTILAYEQIFKAHLSDVSDDFQDFQVEKPRYVRINTLKVTVNEAIEEFRNDEWILKPYPDSSNYLDFLDAVANLKTEEFMIDYHIPYLLVFPPKTEFYQHEAYKNGSIILQDKASCLPVHILNPEPGSTTLDMCAAPGMKTTQCAAVMRDRGRIYAVEIGRKRFQTLRKIIDSSGATCVEAINADVTTLSSEQYPNVEYIIVDPSCSGSGIMDRVEIGQQEIEQQKNRLEKLAAFQITMLRFALTRFPKARRVVYSTCSLYPEENEDVVRQVLETCTTFKLVPAGQFVNNKWENFGSSDFGDIGNYCMYAKPDIDLTNGFFVAVFERLEEGETNQFLNTKLFSRKLNNRVRKEIKEEKREDKEVQVIKEEKREDQEVQVIKEEKREDQEVSEIPKKKKTKKDKTMAGTGEEEINYEESKSFGEDDETKRKKKKKLKQKNDYEEVKVEEYASQGLDSQELHDEEYPDVVISKKKKKKKDRPERVENFLDEEAKFSEEGKEEEVRKSKKKKKEKHRNQSETGNELLEIEEKVSEGHKKKKKKAKNIEESYFEEIDASNKYKIVEHSEIAEDFSCDNDATYKKSKKKKVKT